MDEKLKDLSLALDSTTGAALIPEDLEPVLVELLKRLSPMMGRIPTVAANGSAHDFNRRTSVNQGSMEGENAETPTGQSAFTRVTVPLKIIRANGGVTGFQQAAARAHRDSLMTEIQGAVRGVGWLTEWSVMWGNATADSFQYDGFDVQLTTNRFDQAHGPVTIDAVDQLLDSVEERGAFNTMDMALVMSPRMASRLVQIQDDLRIPRESVEMDGGVRFMSYRGVPIMRSTFVKPGFVTPAPIIADSATAGSLAPATTYDYRIAAVTITGEQVASAKTPHTTGGGITSVDITLPSLAAFGSPVPYLWKVFRSVAGGGVEKLVGVFAGQTYDGDGTPTGLVATINEGAADAVVVAAVDFPQLSTGGSFDETIWAFWFNRDESFALAWLRNEFAQSPATPPAGPNLGPDGLDPHLQLLPLARVKDREDFLIQTYHALALKGELFNAVLRNVRPI